MLSWSSNETGVDVDLTMVAGADPTDQRGRGGISAALHRFATACAETDDAALAGARAALIEETNAGFMVDAAAVAANFEMMTRLADGTGSRLPAERLERSAAAIGAMGVGELTSRR